jgi:hypothetical protein
MLGSTCNTSSHVKRAGIGGNLVCGGAAEKRKRRRGGEAGRDRGGGGDRPRRKEEGWRAQQYNECQDSYQQKLTSPITIVEVIVPAMRLQATECKAANHG